MRTRVRGTVIMMIGLVAVTTSATCRAQAATAAPAHATISGSGSSWAATAMALWSNTGRQQGLTVDYSANGSGAGRADFADGRVDFAASDLSYTEAGETNPVRAFAYFPLTAGAVAFVYQVRVGGQTRRDIRLSGPTLADIFRGAITNWNDPRVTADNHGHQVAPDLAITPVIRSDGSATSYRLTEWFSQRFPKHWRSFSDVGATPYFPSAGGRTIAAAGSYGVVNRVGQPSVNGAIGYAETGYAASAGVSIAPIANASGHFTAPDAGNVSLALLRAAVTTTGSANLRGVYGDPDPRAYPLSYYSYGIVPTQPEPSMTTPKRQTEVDFFGYASCSGQNSATPLGYAPLPLNLTRAGLRALAQIRRADTHVNTRALVLSRCNNSTITHDDDGTVSDNLTGTVPQPPACAAENSDPCEP